MKKVVHKLISMVMAVVVLLSTMSFTLGMHYCGDTLVDTAIFQKAEGCGMEMQKKQSLSDCAIIKKNCCSDEQLVIEGQDELKISYDDVSIDRQLLATTFIYTYLHLFEVSIQKETGFSEYPPPLIVRQIYKLDESYLI